MSARRYRVTAAADPFTESSRRILKWGGLLLLLTLPAIQGCDTEPDQRAVNARRRAVSGYKERPARAHSSRESKSGTVSAQYNPKKVRQLIEAPFSEWTEEDTAYAEALGERTELDELRMRLYIKWFEHATGRVTREEQQSIAERIADELPEAFAVHVVKVEGWDGGFTVTLNPAIQDIWWNIDCDIKRDMLDELVEQWRTALRAAQDSKGTERSMIDVVVRTARGELAHWNAVTGAVVFPLGRCEQ